MKTKNIYICIKDFITFYSMPGPLLPLSEKKNNNIVKRGRKINFSVRDEYVKSLWNLR